MHTIIIGKNHGNRSRWMNELKPLIDDPYGFYTKSIGDHDLGGIRIYMLDLRGEQLCDESTFIGTCINKTPEAVITGYNGIVPALRAIPDGAHVIMDHLGTMDEISPEFVTEVLGLLDRCTVLAALTDRENEYLSKFMNHPQSKCFFAESDSFEEVRRFLLKQTIE